MLGDRGTPRPLAFAIHNNAFKERKRIQGNYRGLCVTLCIPKPEGKCHCGRKQKCSAILLPTSPPATFNWMLFLLNIRKIFMKCNLIHLLKINTEMDFQLINLLLKKGSREMLVNV